MLILPLGFSLIVAKYIHRNRDGSARMRLGEVTCAPRARGLGRGARTRGNTDGSVTATLKQGHRVSAADTAIPRGGIALLQSLQHHPATGKGKSGHVSVQSPLLELSVI